MTKKKFMRWRLKEQPTAESIAKLVEIGVLNKDEAREILFSEETKKERSEKSLKSEIKFLRELVEKLSDNKKSNIITTIREIELPYKKWDWYKPYVIWCDNTAWTSNSIEDYSGFSNISTW